MGSGKSYWGKQWSQVSRLRFYDLDDEIEKAKRMKITAIFQKKGEEKFREMERMHLHKFGRKKNFILACGGGTPCFFDNLEWMKSRGKVIYLKATPARILKNLKNETSHRPVLQASPEDMFIFIKSKLKERKTFYEGADEIVDTAMISPATISKLVKSK